MGQVLSRKSIIFDILFESKNGNANVKKTVKELQKADQAADSFNKTLKGAAFQLAGIVSATIGARDALNTISEFDTAMSSLSAITGATGDELEFLEKQAKESGRSVKGGAVAVAQAFELIGSKQPALLENRVALVEVTEAAIKLAEASGLELPVAADALTSTINQMGLSASEATRVINALAAGAKFGAAAIPQLKDTISEFGTVAAAANITTEQSVALAEVLAEKNLTGARAGIQLRNVVLRLQAANIGYVDGQFNVVAALEELEKKQLSATEAQKLFGLESVTAGKILIDNIGQFKELTDKVTGTSVAFEQAAINTDNLKSATDRLRAEWDTIVLNFVGGTGAMVDGIEFLTRNLETLVKVVVVAATAFGGYKLAIITTSAITKGLTLATTAYRIAQVLMTKGTKAATIAMRAFNVATKASPIGLLVGLVSAAATAFLLFRDNADDATESQENLNSAISDGNDLLDKTRQFVDNAIINGFNPANASIQQLESALDLLNDRLRNSSGDIVELTINGQTFTQNLQEQREEMISLIAQIERELQSRQKAADAIKDQGSALDRLKKDIQETKKALEEQALAGNLSQDTLDRYKDLVDKLETSQRALARALRGTGDEIEKLEGKTSGTLIPETLKKIDEFDLEGSLDQYKSARIQIERDIQDATVDLVRQGWDAIVEIQSRALERRLEASQVEMEQQLALAGEDAQARARIEERFANEQARLRKRIAINERSAKVFGIVVDTAEAAAAIQAQAAILAANPATAALSGLALSQLGLLFASSALQTGLIMSAPLPGFARGTKNAPEGFAKVGEQGEEIVWLPQGAKVMDNKRSRLFDALQDTPHLNTETVHDALRKAGVMVSGQSGDPMKDYSEQFYRQYLATKGNKKIRLENTDELAKAIGDRLASKVWIDSFYN